MLDFDFANVDHPDKVAAFLERCAQACYEADGELTAAWQDKGAGHPWAIVAKELERCAQRIKDRV